MENSNSGSGIVAGTSVSVSANEDSNTSGGNPKEELAKAADWSYYEDIFQEGEEDLINSDSDFEYEDTTYTKKKPKGVKKPSKPKGVSLISYKMPMHEVKHGAKPAIM